MNSAHHHAELGVSRLPQGKFHGFTLAHDHLIDLSFATLNNLSLDRDCHQFLRIQFPYKQMGPKIMFVL